MSVHKIICGKSEIELKQFDDDSFDSCVCDPPYNLTSITRPRPDQTKEGGYGKEVPFSRVQSRMSGGFMGKDWDGTGIPFKVELWEEVYRVVKPGAHILVFGGDRTEHRMKCAVEGAGFEIRGTIVYCYGSGFPKSLDVSKSIDKMNGVEHPVGKKINENIAMSGGNYTCPKREVQSEEAIQWDGWGTGLKPAVELICMARKPISERNIAANVLRWGTGGLNILECRIGNDIRKSNINDFSNIHSNKYGSGAEIKTIGYKEIQGRFPANLILDEETGRMLDEQSGQSKSVYIEGGANRRAYQEHEITNPSGWKEVNRQRKTEGFNDYGGASRFFYQAKASQKERWFYCTICQQAYPMKERDKHTHNAPEETKYKYLEFHPTQKPESLLCYLMRLITPPNGTTIDPFLGSGTAIIAAKREGFDCVGIDSKPEYCEMGYVRGKAELAQQKISGEQPTIERIGF